MLDNSGSLDARIATQMGMTEVLRKDKPFEIQTARNDYNQRHEHAPVAAKGGLFSRFNLKQLLR
jgi:hypothetical protein